MLVTIKDKIENQIVEFKQSVSLEEIELFGDSKIAATISTPHLMGSIEVVKELTADMLIVEYDSEDVVYSESFDCVSGPSELTEIISTFLSKINDSEKKYQGSN